VRVFLAAHEDGNLFMIRRVYTVGPKCGKVHWQTVYATTMVLGHVVLQVLGNTHSDYRAFELGGVAHDRSQTIVPPVIGGSIWPPKDLLSDAALDDFGREFLRATAFIDVDDPKGSSTSSAADLAGWVDRVHHLSPSSFARLGANLARQVFRGRARGAALA